VRAEEQSAVDWEGDNLGSLLRIDKYLMESEGVRIKGDVMLREERAE
jgi:hypothetical protein